MPRSKFLRIIQAKNIEVDELGKAKQFKLFSIARPFMRSFHAAWFCFFVAFTTWFGIQPLLPTISKELNLSKTDIANSGIANVAATVAVRITIGPLCDKYGPRRMMSCLLILGSIPMALAGLIKNGTDLIILRLFIGILGGTFVPCQFWTTAVFSSKIVGTANAIVGGWGNLGGGFAFILMPGLFEMMKAIGAESFLAWKLAVIVPAVICIITGVLILFTSDDCPQGKWENRILPGKAKPTNSNPKNSEVFENKGFENDLPVYKDTSNSEKSCEGELCVKTNVDETLFKPGEKPLPTNTGKTQLQPGEKYLNTNSGESLPQTQEIINDTTGSKLWLFVTVVILTMQYGMCFGVEIAVNTVMNLFFLYKFKIDGCVESNAIIHNATNATTTQVSTEVANECSLLDQNTASLIASLFGLMNLFARALGGVYSDVFRKHLSIAGRLIAHFTSLVGEGVMLITFSKMTTIPSAIVVMVIFSTFVQMSEGTTYSIVPYVSPRHVGIVAGIVGAGGNAGALIWNTIWRELVTSDQSEWFWILGIIVLSGSMLTFFTIVREERIWYGLVHFKMKKRKYNF